MASDDGPAETEPFETLYQRLEATVARLEAGDVSLDEALNLYEEGMALAERCRLLLDTAELRVTRLQERFNAVAQRPTGVREDEGLYIADEEELPF